MQRKLNLKLIAIVVVGFVIAATGVHFLHGYQLQRNAFRLLEYGDRAMEEKDFDKAQDFYAQYLDFVPDDVATLQKYALALDQNASLDERVRLTVLMEQVLRVKPNEVALRFRLVHNQIALGRYSEAADNLRKLQGSWSDKAEVLHMLGWCQDALKEYGKAIQSFEEAIRINPKQVRSYVLLAEQLQERVHRPQEAKKVMEDLVRVNSDAYQAYVARAQFLRRQGDDSAAEADLKVAQKLSPNQVDVVLESADLARTQGNWLESLQLLQTALTEHADHINDRAQLKRALADTMRRLGDWPSAERLLRDVARDIPRDAQTRFALCEIALQTNRADEARAWLEQVRALEGEQSPRARLGAIGLQVRQANGRRAQLEDARRKLQELEPEHKTWSKIPLLAGTISELEGKYQQAVQEYAHALELGETQPRVLASLLGLLVQRRDFSQAESELAKYEQKQALTPDLARLGADIALGLRDPRYGKIAVKRAEQAVAQPVRDYRDALWLAHIYQAVGDNANAEALLQESLKLAGHTPDTWIAWIGFLQQSKQHERGVAELAQMKRAIPSGRQTLTLARCYEALGMPYEADAAFGSALQAAPDDFTTLDFAANFYRRADRPEEAIPIYERMLDPVLGAPAESTVPARRHLAALFAPQDARRALAVLEQNKKSRGDTLADERVRWFIQSQSSVARADAIAQFQESLRQAPPAPEERWLLARMLQSAGSDLQARTQLAELVDSAPQSAQYAARFARLLIRMNELDEAARQVVRLETLEPASARTRAIRQVLKSVK